ncbi:MULTISPECIES: DUF6495 family protein [Mesonia]|uniref:Uncharacterized protein n=1 Tax=Mesonia oceanica TaxID=2687242 RepID=A0AC61Y797_9FLAO|nr:MULTISPECIES: DUF6495 family protein [Mesonia]MAN26843.1 hypothetical protein [Mesonia sp.]MAQ40543.1 hypothetical protein [Mesonia sp.]MBJ98233.1 hypothetical protein [Flavobacteriaceae bacterium]VVV00386.1 hypothetical protein FVB9532_01656 [Mesonia oceanica]|tara:strand:+ start:55912 stop:56388 length:477 start_codon:yes stop_codon:yes gene_type:complete
MKYTRLTKEQLEEMHQEFINFLAAQSITAEEWAQIKQEKPKVAEEELDVFSDLVWEGVLNQAKYLEHFSKQQMFLFKIGEAQMTLVGVKVENPTIDIRTKEGYAWLQDNLLNDQVQIYTSTKAIVEDRNQDIFALIKQGANITQGDLFQYFEKLIEVE